MRGKLHEPTEESRLVVQAYATVGVPLRDIGEKIGVNVKTLKKHYAEELRIGQAEANATVISTAFRMAKSGRSWAATEFWLKTRLSTVFREPKHQTQNDHSIRVVYEDDQPAETSRGPAEGDE